MKKRGGFEKEWPGLKVKIKHACRKLGKRVDDDLLQDICSEIIAGRHKHATAKQMVIDHLRRQLSRDGTQVSQVRKALLNACAIEKAYYIKAPDWVGELTSRLDVKKLLDEMPKFYALIIDLYDIDGYDFVEIAELLGCTHSNVALHHKHAIALLTKRALGPLRKRK